MEAGREEEDEDEDERGRDGLNAGWACSFTDATSFSLSVCKVSNPSKTTPPSLPPSLPPSPSSLNTRRSRLTMEGRARKASGG